MSTYWQIFKLGLQNTATYRFNFFFRALFNVVPLIAALTLWRAIFAGRHDEVGGYTLAQILSYYLVATMVETLTAVTEDEWQISNDIKDGQISQFLVRPLEYLQYRFCLFCANRVIYSAVAFVPVAVMVALNAKYLLPPAGGAALAGFCVAVLLAGCLQFLLAYLTAIVAFWFLEISTLAFMLLAVQWLAGGEMFPLDLLPSWLTQLFMLTPFPYCMFFPVQVYMGRFAGMEMISGLAVQALWVFILWAVGRLVWYRGLRTYTAVGG